jgi:hypothetical protein
MSASHLSCYLKELKATKTQAEPPTFSVSLFPCVVVHDSASTANSNLYSGAMHCKEFFYSAITLLRDLSRGHVPSSSFEICQLLALHFPGSFS